MNDMTNRRKFLKGGAIAGAAAQSVTLAAPSIAKGRADDDSEDAGCMGRRYLSRERESLC